MFRTIGKSQMMDTAFDKLEMSNEIVNEKKNVCRAYNAELCALMTQYKS